jgi:site-specific DNA-methyltransferase (adenine-specific)
VAALGDNARYFTVTEWDAFRYVAKPSRTERNAGLDKLPQRQVRTTYDKVVRDSNGGDSGSPRANHHPTVKPLALMRWLIRLVTPPNGTILDPFAGSGTTLAAAALEHVHAIGIELTADYLPIIHARITWAEQQTHQPTLDI